MIRLNFQKSAKAWDEYAAKCATHFGAPNHRIAAFSKDLEYPPPQILLAGKLLLAGCYSSGLLAKYKDDILNWVGYLPRFGDDACQAAMLNGLWARRLCGQKLNENESCLVDQYLEGMTKAASELRLECSRYLDVVQRSIKQDDRLLLYKACILLDVELEPTLASLRKTIMAVCFPSTSG